MMLRERMKSRWLSCALLAVAAQTVSAAELARGKQAWASSEKSNGQMAHSLHHDRVF